MNRFLSPAIEALRQGHTLLYPTDTLWGIGCDASNAEAVEKIYTLKERDHAKSMLVLCTPRLMALADDPASRLLASSDVPTTVILSRNDWQRMLPPGSIAPNLPAADGTLGIRIPKHALCQSLIDGLGHPLVSTSANLSGHPSPLSHADIAPQLFSRIDFCLPPLPEWESHAHSGSRILKLEADGEVTILRP